MKTLAIMQSVLALAACTSLPVTTQQPNDWDRTLYYARRDVDAGNYFAADRVLDEYARVHPGTREATDIGFWKAAYMLDPANGQGSLGGGIAALDAYLAASDSSGRYRNEALVLRRTAAAAQVATSAASSAPAIIVQTTPSSTQTKDTVVVVTKSREEEIASLRDQLAKSKDELAKVSAELDRIKKRLANPDK
jgi:hypothetical protein